MDELTMLPVQKASVWEQVLSFIRRTTIHPNSRFSRLWNVTVLIAVILTVFSDPFFSSFVVEESGKIFQLATAGLLV